MGTRGENVEPTGSHLVEQPAIDAGEAADTKGAPAVEKRQKAESFLHEPLGAGSLVFHETGPLGADASFRDVLLADAEAFELVLRKVNPAESPILGYVAH